MYESIKNAVRELNQFTIFALTKNRIAQRRADLRKRRIPALVNINTMLLEITMQCPGPICRYCYRRSFGTGDVGVTTDGPHVPKETLFARINWIEEHTTAHTVSIIGGELLLHPDFQEIALYILQKGLRLDIITCGSVDAEIGERNLQYLAALYAAGLVTVELSVHSGPKYEGFIRTYRLLESCARLRELTLRLRVLALRYDSQRRWLFAYASDLQESYALTGTLVIDRRFATTDVHMTEFLAMLYMRARTTSMRGITLEGVHNPVHYELAAPLLIAPFRSSINFPSGPVVHQTSISWRLDVALNNEGDGSTCSIRMITGTEVRASRDDARGKSGVVVRKVVVPSGSPWNARVCPSMQCKAYADLDVIRLSAVHLITVEGELTFANPQCVTVRHGLCNVAHHTTREEICAVTDERLRVIHEEIFRAKAARTGETPCYADPEFATKNTASDTDAPCWSCPFDVACNACQGYDRNA